MDIIDEELHYLYRQVLMSGVNYLNKLKWTIKVVLDYQLHPHNQFDIVVVHSVDLGS